VQTAPALSRIAAALIIGGDLPIDATTRAALAPDRLL